MSKELKIFKYLTPEEYLEVEKKRFLAGYPDFKVNWNAFPNPEPKPEPVVWVSLSDIDWINIVNSPKILELTNERHNSEEAVNLAVKMTEEICKKKNSNLIPIPIPNREPLSDENIRTIINHLPSEVDLEIGIEFCKIIEKVHGIGVDNE